MGMLKHDFKAELKRLEKFLGEDMKRVLQKAEFFALKQALSSASTEATKLVRKRTNLKNKAGTRKIKAAEFKSEFLKAIQPRRNREGKASLRISGKPISMRRFLVGSPIVPNQKGVKVKRRKKTKVKVFRGKSTHLKSAFLARVGGNVHIFVRSKKSSQRKIVSRSPKVTSQLPIKKIAGSGMTVFMSKVGIIDLVLKKASVVLDLSYGKKIRFFANKEIDRRFKFNIKNLK